MPQLYAALQAPKQLLFGPGPSMVATRVYQAMSQPVVGHLDKVFRIGSGRTAAEKVLGAVV